MMKEKLKEVAGLLILPLVLIVTYGIVVIVWRILDLPTNDALIDLAGTYVQRYGLWLVFVAAIIEGFFLLGQYFPGGAIIFLGVISANGDVSRAIAVVAVTCAAFAISYTLNYLLGKHGWYKLLVRFGLEGLLESSRRKLAQQGLHIIFFTYWNSNLAAMTATAAGMLHIPMARFQVFSILGILLWNTFWGILVFHLGRTAFQLMGVKYVLIVFVLWCAVILVKSYFFDRRK